MKMSYLKTVLVVVLLSTISCEENIEIRNESKETTRFTESNPDGQRADSYHLSGDLTAEAPRYDGSESGPIDLQLANSWIQNFKENMTSQEEIRSHYFGRNVIDNILSQPGCTGLRIYYALKDNGEKVLIISGVDSNGNNQLPSSQTVTPGENILADYSWPCPNFCPPNEL
jgi:hypothetical protein